MFVSNGASVPDSGYLWCRLYDPEAKISYFSRAFKYSSAEIRNKDGDAFRDSVHANYVGVDSKEIVFCFANVDSNHANAERDDWTSRDLHRPAKVLQMSWVP